jgi:hypothetical protein
MCGWHYNIWAYDITSLACSDWSSPVPDFRHFLYHSESGSVPKLNLVKSILFLKLRLRHGIGPNVTKSFNYSVHRMQRRVGSRKVVPDPTQLFLSSGSGPKTLQILPLTSKSILWKAISIFLNIPHRLKRIFVLSSTKHAKKGRPSHNPDWWHGCWPG